MQRWPFSFKLAPKNTPHCFTFAVEWTTVQHYTTLNLLSDTQQNSALRRRISLDQIMVTGEKQTVQTKHSTTGFVETNSFIFDNAIVPVDRIYTMFSCKVGSHSNLANLIGLQQKTSKSNWRHCHSWASVKSYRLNGNDKLRLNKPLVNVRW